MTRERNEKSTFWHSCGILPPCVRWSGGGNISIFPQFSIDFKVMPLPSKQTWVLLLNRRNWVPAKMFKVKNFLGQCQNIPFRLKTFVSVIIPWGNFDGLCSSQPVMNIWPGLVRETFLMKPHHIAHTHLLTRVVPGFKDHGTGSFFIFLQFRNSGLIFNAYDSRNLKQSIIVFSVLETSQWVKLF